MPDIIITPSSGIIDFFPVSTRVGRIEGSGNTINIVNPSGFVAVSGSGLSINTSSPNATFHAYSATSGATILNIEGTNGSLFSVVDNLSGSLMSVNNNAGLPVFEVFSDDRVVAGRFGQNDFIMTSGGNVGIGTGVPSSKFHVIGTSTFNGDVSSTGSFIAGSGTAALPSFEFINDPDTGLFSPAANTFGISTSGVERLRIDNIGRIGVGTNSPTQSLDVSGTIRSYVGDSSLTFLTERTGVNSGGMGIDFSLGYTNIKSLNSIRLLTGSTTAGTARLFIDSSNGNVGIGTGVQATSPPEKLTVDGNIRVADTSVTQGNIVQFSRGGGGQYDYSIGKYNPALAISLSNDSSTQRPLQVGYHSGTTFLPQFHVNGYNGSVGIGTTSPSARLEVATSGTTSLDIAHFSNSNGVERAKISLSSAGDGTFSIIDASNNTDIFLTSNVSTASYINAGNFGVGTTSPTSTLQVSGLITSNSGNFTNSLQLNGSGVGLYDTSVFNLGTISGSNAINCGQDRQIQTLTLNGVATTFTTGTGWPSSSSVARETTLNIFSSGNTSITWTIVNDWYRQPDSPLPSGRHIVLLRSVGSGTMQGHYIGNKTN
jgi:hypothetical protein